MALHGKVNVAGRFQRSIRIDTDLNDVSALEGYICPQSSRKILVSVSRQLAETEQGAFTWTGPYGSGKSSLLIILNALLSGKRQLREIAAEAVGEETSEQVWNAFPMDKRKGWIVLPIIGRRTNPVHVIAEALIEQGLCPASELKAPYFSDKLLKMLQKIANNSSGGLIVFLDEMGKFLEGAAQENTDIYFFQELAEVASRSRGRLVVIGILHQAFEEYTNRLSREMREEWSKIQGRFIDIPINIAGEEQIELLGRAIIKKLPFGTKKFESDCKKVLENIRTNRPAVSEALGANLLSCWPLHPIVACLLGPLSKRRFGQNQRSIFGFLNSAETNGFQDYLKHEDESLYTPERLWDYLRINLEPSILASPDGHRWSLAVETVERAEARSADGRHTNLAKCIALLDMFKESSGLVPSTELLATFIPLKELPTLLEDLTKWSCVIFKNYLNAYSIYAGSDFNLEKILSEVLFDIQAVNFNELKQLIQLPPVLAKRHYHVTGAMRWFDVTLTGLSELQSSVESYKPVGDAMGQFILAIPTSGESVEDAQKICRHAARCSEGCDVGIGLSTRSWLITELARELLALERIRQTRDELAGDHVARREVEARIAYVSGQLEKELQNAFNTATWHIKNFEEKKVSFSGLNQLASDLAEKRFSYTPKIHNELLNRIKPSSNAVAAQKALLRQMVLKEGEERLGMLGFPAERGLFVSLLESTSLYQENDGEWQFVTPAEHQRADKARLRYLWEAATSYLQENQKHSVSAQDIYNIWMAPPYGVREGLLPVLFVAFVLSQKDQVAFYRERIFQARIKDLEIDYLTNDPSSIQLRWMNLSEVSKRILSGMAAIARELGGAIELQNEEPIDVARRLISIFDDLKPWTRRTQRLSSNAVRIRNLFKQANDPNKFLFDDIPALFQGEADISSEKGVNFVVNSLKEGLTELIDAYPFMLNGLRDQMLFELQVQSISTQALADLRGRALNIQQVGGDFRLEAFITRLSCFTGSPEDIEGIASLAANKPPRDWIDRDLDLAAVELAELAQKFNRLESFARVKGRSDKRQAMAVVVGLNGRPTPLLEEFNVTESERKAVDEIISVVGEILQQGNSNPRNIILAALAELSARYMGQETIIVPPKDDNGKRKKAASV